MTDKKDVPPKDAERRLGEGARSGAKRPFATLDLAAREVASGRQEAAGEGSKSGAAQPGSGAPYAATDKQRADQTARAARVAAAATAMRHSSAESADSVGKADATSMRSGAGGSYASQGIGRFASQLAAGVLGALLALVGSHLLMSPSSAPPAGNSDRLQGLSQRLSALERSPASEGQAQLPADAAKRLQATESGLARLDEVGRRLDEVRRTQARLAAALGGSGAAGDISGRLDGLEKRLSALSAVAEADPQAASRMAQVAQLTGRVNDLETAVTSRLTSLRSEMEERVALAANAGEAAKSGVERLDREMSTVRSEAAQVGQRVTDLKSSTDRQEQALRALRTDTNSLKAALEGLKSDLEGRLAAAAKPSDINAAVAPIGEKVASLESNLKGVVRAEDERKANAQRIVLSIELTALKRAMERSGGYARELAAVEKVAGENFQLGPLQRYQHDGVPTQAELLREFRPVANGILDADAEQPDASIVDRLLSGARTIVRVRRTTHAMDDTSTEAIVGRMEIALKEARLADVLAEAKRLPAKAAVPAQDWLNKIEARRSVDAALARIDASLKASLGAASSQQTGQGQ